MNTKEKGKSKRGKAIIGIALAAIMLASVFAAMVPMGMARDESTDPEPGCINEGDTLFIDEHSLHFDTSILAANSAFKLKKVEDGTVVKTLSFSNSSKFTVPSTEEGGYRVYDNGNWEGNVTIDTPGITADVFKEGTTNSIVDKSVPVTTKLNIRVKPNFGGLMRNAADGSWSKIKIKLDEPGGGTYEYSEKFDADAQEMDIDSTDWDMLDTTNWDTGTWKVQIVTDKDTCNEVDISSSEYEFTIRSEELTIEADVDEVGRGEDIILTVKGNPSWDYYFVIENVIDNKEPKIKDTTDVVSLGKGEGTTNITAAWLKTGSDGVADIKITTSVADERTYTMHVYDDATPSAGYPTSDDIGDNYDKHAEVDVEVTEAEVTFDMPTKAVIGEEVMIKGSVNAGDKIDILIEDKYEDEVKNKGDNIDIDENNEFEAKWKTEGYMTGSYTIKVYINKKGTEDVDLDKDDEDGTVTIRLIEQGLDAEQPRNVVAEDDDYQIIGTATGVDKVDYVLIGPKGSKDGAVDDITGGLLIDSASVKDDEFDVDDIAMKEGLDTGSWVTLVLIPGRDGGYGDYGKQLYGAGNLDKLATDQMTLGGKDQSQIVSIIEDNTLARAGSDDKIVAFSFKVESGYVDLNPVESVAAGDPLNISGVTNREPETSITISTFAKPAGAIDLPAVITEVEWITTDEGTFTATIDTEDAVEGTYVLEADDGDGNTDTVTVVIGEAAPEPTPTPEPTAEPTATAIPTAEPTAEPAAEPTATPEDPGFEAVFAIAGLLSIAYLVLRKRRE